MPPRRAYDLSSLGPDASAGATVLFLTIPQGLAYATIAGLPPATGLYAATLPTIVGSLLRSSRFVVSGPTNALSLLVGGATAVGLGGDPVGVAITLALMVGVLQAAAGFLRLGALVDFISSAVVLGYITGAALLIAIGQLYNVTGTTGPTGRIWETLGGWGRSVPAADLVEVATAIGTVIVVIGIRYLNQHISRHIPAATASISLALLVNVVLGLEDVGLDTIGTTSPVASGLPPLTIPSLDAVGPLLPLAIACAVLSLVESSAVARSIASRTGDRLDASTEFFGQGLSNIAAAFCGGYPVSGSLTRSMLAERMGARSRLAGVFSGIAMIGALVFLGPVLDHIPIASLAGLLLVIAWDLVDVEKIRRTIRASRADAGAFVATGVGTWVLSLDLAIYLGVGISLALFLRRARLLATRELVISEQGILREQPLGIFPPESRRCPQIRMLSVEGALFFGAAGELQAALDEVARPDAVRVVIVRVKRTQGLDVTTAGVLEGFARLMRSQGRHLLLVGMTPDTMQIMRRSGVADALGQDNLFPTEKRWFAALDAARVRAVALCGQDCATCPFATATFVAPAGDTEG